MPPGLPTTPVTMATRLLVLVLVTSPVQAFHYPRLSPVTTTLSEDTGVQGPAPSESFPYQDRLTQDYTLYWNFNTTHITFEMVVRTNGWIGFGISPKGTMEGSDVIIGWVKDGQVHFADRHAGGRFLPARDSSQDWALVNATEIDDYTVVKVVRPLDTCDDPEDLPILPGTTRVIYAYSPTDPPSDDAIDYHKNTRGTKSILLLDPPDSEKVGDSLPSDVKVLELTNQNVSVPSSDTTYWCTFWKLPDLGGKHHMIRYEPIIQAGHEQMFHHLVLYYCTGDAGDESYSPSSFNCYDFSGPAQKNQCMSNILLAWAIGGKVFNFPSNVGYPFGGAGDPGYFVMETHFDNPGGRSGLVDDSGMRLYLTQQLRENDAGTVMAGVDVSKDQIIPPYEQSFLSQGICGQTCLGEALGDQEIHVFANMLHSHLIGVKLRTRHFRNGVELPPLQEDNNYDFDYQETRPVPEERVIKKGDSLLVECEYDSTGRTQVTYGGISSRQEMCLSFVMYYPRIELTRCTTRINYSTRPVEWNAIERVAFRMAVENSQHTQICLGPGRRLEAHRAQLSTKGYSDVYQTPRACAFDSTNSTDQEPDTDLSPGPGDDSDRNSSARHMSLGGMALLTFLYVMFFKFQCVTI